MGVEYIDSKHIHYHYYSIYYTTLPNMYYSTQYIVLHYLIPLYYLNILLYIIQYRFILSH